MLIPNPALRTARYRVPRAKAPVDLVLDGNEGPALQPADLLPLVADPEVVRRYPKAAALEALLAERYGVRPEQVLVSAGGDDLIDRCCRAFCGPERSAVLPVPGFAMTRRYAELAGAPVVEVPWTEDFPAAACAEVDGSGMIVVTSPNNPTGAVVEPGVLTSLSQARPDALILLDAAYAEFAEDDRTVEALQLPNAVVIRTLSKAWGLAGLRVGFVLGPAEVVGWLRAAGAPYPVSGPSLALAMRRLEGGEASMRRFVSTAIDERGAIEATLDACGAAVTSGQANFAFARVERPLWLRDAMAGLGIGIRAFPERPALRDAVRISVPGDSEALDRVCSGLRAALRPQALLLDLDGVVADVSGSYRAAIRATAASFGVEISESRVLAAKAAGDANNDWVVTRNLLSESGVEVTLSAVTERFEALVQGSPAEPGLWTRETLLISREVLQALAQALPLAAVTGRPRLDAVRFMKTQGIADLFDAVVCMEDAQPKPDPAPVRLALRKLGVQAAWMVGDTPDDARAARSAGVVPLGVRTGGVADEALYAAGCARVVDDLSVVVELLPNQARRAVRCAK